MSSVNMMEGGRLAEAVRGSLKQSGRMLFFYRGKQKNRQTEAGRVCSWCQMIKECCVSGTPLHIILNPVPGALPRSRLLILISITVSIITIIISVIGSISSKQPSLCIWSPGSRSGTEVEAHCWADLGIPFARWGSVDVRLSKLPGRCVSV